MASRALAVLIRSPPEVDGTKSGKALCREGRKHLCVKGGDGAEHDYDRQREELLPRF